MNEPVRVVVLTPKRKRSASITLFALQFLSAYLLMLLIPLWSGWNLGYVQVLALVLTIRFLREDYGVTKETIKENQ